MRKKALTRCEYDGLRLSEAARAGPGGEQQLAALAMDRYAYYVCSKCGKVGGAGYGGPSGCSGVWVGGISSNYKIISLPITSRNNKRM